ncbi:MAG TPA: hypothetical protein PLX03_07775 [Candidatus Hydrogenedentes bacterium]|nr:hypothetical protein [Candidatus Hydrogenedentota bacterium]
MGLTAAEIRARIETLEKQLEHDRQRIAELKDRLAAADRKRASLPVEEQSRLDPILDMLERELDYAKARCTEDEQNLIKLRRKLDELRDSEEEMARDIPEMSGEELRDQTAVAGSLMSGPGEGTEENSGLKILLGSALAKIQRRDFEGLSLQEIRALRMCYDRLLHRVNRNIREDRLKSMIAASLRALDRMKKLPPESGNSPI